MNKAALRKKYLEKRMMLSPAEKEMLEDLMLLQFQRLPEEVPATIMSFVPLEKYNEFNPIHVEEYCAFKTFDRQTLCFPVMVDDGLQAIVADEHTAFVERNFGVMEPEDGAIIEPSDIGMVFVPLLAFDASGYRVGYGKGFYDRFLKKCSPDVITVGFSFFSAVTDISDIHEHDIPLNYCITPEEIFTFS